MVDRQTFQEYQEDPIGFAKRKEKEAKEEGLPDVEKLWEKHRTKLEELEGHHEHTDNGHAEAEEIIAYSEATRMLDILQEGPSWWRRLIWKAEDVGAYISSFVSWIGSLFAEVLDWLKDNSATVTGVIAYSAVILAVIWMFMYMVEYKLIFQLVVGTVIAIHGLLIMIVSEKTATRNITAGVLVGLIALFTLVFSVAPGPDSDQPHYAGVVTDRSTHEVTRILETPAALSAFGFNEIVTWYKVGDEDDPVSKKFEDVNGLDITVLYHLIPKVKRGDTVNTKKLGSPLTRKRVSQVVENSLETDNAVSALGLQNRAKHLRRKLEVSNELFAVAVESVEISATAASETRED